MMLAQIFGVIVLAIVLIYLIINIRKQGYDVITLLSMAVIVFLIFLSAAPQLILGSLQEAGFARVTDVFLYVISLLALLLAIKVYFKQAKTQRDITNLIQRIALKDIAKAKTAPTSMQKRAKKVKKINKKTKKK